MSAEVDDAIRQAAGHVLVYVLPFGHPEAAKVAQLRLANIAGQVKVVIDGPAVSRLLVGFAIYNLGRETAIAVKARNDGGLTRLQISKMLSSSLDLGAASMKLHAVLYPQAITSTGRFVQRPLFDLKNAPLAGPWIAEQLRRQ